jgi:hypothetical protein
MRALTIIVWFAIGAGAGWLIIWMKELLWNEYWRGHADGYAMGVAVMKEHPVQINGTCKMVTVYELGDRWNDAIEEE